MSEDGVEEKGRKTKTDAGNGFLTMRTNPRTEQTQEADEINM